MCHLTFPCSSPLEILSRVLNIKGTLLSSLPPIFRSENLSPNQLPWFSDHSKPDIYLGLVLKLLSIKSKIIKY